MDLTVYVVIVTTAKTHRNMYYHYHIYLKNIFLLIIALMINKISLVRQYFFPTPIFFYIN